MGHLKSWGLALLSGLLLWACWPVSPFTFLVFGAFVPLIWLAHRISNRLAFLGFTYVGLLVWNAGTTWWICNSTLPGGIAAILANSALMCIPWLGFFNLRRRLGDRVGYAGLVVYWLAFEYVHLNWELSWPWLTVGNVFSNAPGWVQWYEFTGTSGGTLWVMVTNVLVARIVLQWKRMDRKNVYRSATAAALTVLIPIVISYLVAPRATDTAARAARSIVVVQPNIDPYLKFEEGMQEGQLQTLIALSESRIDSTTALVVWPETALNMPSGLELDRLAGYPYLVPLWSFLQRHPNITLLSGVEGLRFFSEADKTRFSRRIGNAAIYYDSYNAAALFDQTGPLQFYSKSKLVPGVETLPSFLRILDRWFEQFGGTTGGYASQEDRTVLKDPAGRFHIAPAICYESIFGEFLTAYVRNGADLICIITNDGWWANTSGHKQHMAYARLRAIETRKWIARSANTGISCFIDPRGAVLKPQPWDTASAISLPVPAEKGQTFYVTFRDVISKASLVTAAALVLWSTALGLFARFNRKKSADAKKRYPSG